MIDELFARCERIWWHELHEYERRALCFLAELDANTLTRRQWSALGSEERELLLFAMRQAAALGDVCRRALK